MVARILAGNPAGNLKIEVEAMKKEVSPVVATVVILIAVLIAAFLLWKGYRGEKTAQVSDIGQQVNAVIQKSGGDLSKLTPEDRAVLERAMKQGYPLPPGLQAQLSGGGGGTPVSGVTPMAPPARR